MLKQPIFQICSVYEPSIFDDYIKWCKEDRILDPNTAMSYKEIVGSIKVFAHNTMEYEMDTELNRMVIKERFQYILERFSEKFNVKFDHIMNKVYK